MNNFENLILDEERALYGICGKSVSNCRFEGPKDGESALKECKNVTVSRCNFDLRYPFWHDENVTIDDCKMTENCRAALWYSQNIAVKDSDFCGIKVFRECNDIFVNDTKIISPECFWFCKNIEVNNSSVDGVYGFFKCENVSLNGVHFGGKYSFQYVENLNIENCVLDTKDAFWHSNNVTVKNSIVKGEYLGWYSNNLTLINCKISGTQPLCYAQNLKLIDCTMENCDLAFEYSDVTASVSSHIDSIKNPISGSIKALSIGEIIFDECRRDNGDVIITQG